MLSDGMVVYYANEGRVLSFFVGSLQVVTMRTAGAMEEVVSCFVGFLRIQIQMIHRVVST